jgi:hypothetical protein
MTADHFLIIPLILRALPVGLGFALLHCYTVVAVTAAATAVRAVAVTKLCVGCTLWQESRIAIISRIHVGPDAAVAVGLRQIC